MYTFGDKGTLAWASPSGELLSVAKCVKNKLVGIEYKNGIERGRYYSSRGKTLSNVVNLPHGEGYGMGISLDLNLNAVDTCWVSNRWPRFTYKHNALDIRLQYYVNSHSIFQQYQIRNNGDEEAHLPCIISSDICFWEHNRETEKSFHPVPTGKSLERLLLFQNSQVLIRDAAGKAQLKMELFFNAQRVSCWADEPLSGEEEATESTDTKDTSQELELGEDELRVIIMNKKPLSFSEDYALRSMYAEYYNGNLGRKQPRGLMQKNFAKHRKSILLPAQSTQEICMIVQIAGIPRPGADTSDRPSEKHDNSSSTPLRGVGEHQFDYGWRLQIYDEMFQRQYNVLKELENLTGNTTNSSHKSRAADIVKDQLWLGNSYVRLGRLGEARYHYHFACLCAESFNKEDLYSLSKTRFEYAKFLDAHEWHSTALEVLDGTFKEWSTWKFGNVAEKDLWADIISRLAPMYFEKGDKGDFSRAESLFEKAFNHFSKNGKEHNPSSAHFLERIACAQAYQGNYAGAETHYRYISSDS